MPDAWRSSSLLSRRRRLRPLCAGHAFAYGTCGQNPFVGASNFFSADAEQDSDTYWAGWFFVSARLRGSARGCSMRGRRSRLAGRASLGIATAPPRGGGLGLLGEG